MVTKISAKAAGFLEEKFPIEITDGFLRKMLRNSWTW